MKKIILLTVLSIMCLLLFNTITKMDKKTYNNETVEKKTNGLKVDFDRLQEKNEDIVGWLIVKDTDINYPILKGDDNEFYRYNDSLLNPSKSGSIFQDYNELSLDDKSVTLYGNNLNKGMFADLRKVYNHELGNDVYAKVITEDYIYTYKVYETKRNHVESDTDYQIDVTSEDNILNLISLGGTFEYSVSAFRISVEPC